MPPAPDADDDADDKDKPVTADKIPMSLFGGSSPTGSFDFLKNGGWKTALAVVLVFVMTVLLIAPKNWRSPEAWVDRIVHLFDDEIAARRR